MKVHKKKTTWTAGSMAMMLCMLLFSCNDEQLLEDWNMDRGYGSISFGISPDEDIQTRGIDSGRTGGRTTDRFVLRSADSADTLCVRTIISDGINLPRTDQTITRGTPLEGDAFHESFHVLAYWSTDGGTTVKKQFYMNEDVQKNGSQTADGKDIWATQNIYYWPGAAHSFQFYAWAPADIPAENLTATPTPTSKSLTYTVPPTATDQKDIVVATTDWINGDKNAAVPLDFKHICTAVRFEVGSQMQEGKINSITLKNVNSEGTYNMESGTWTQTSTPKNFTYDFDMKMEGDETSGDPITDVNPATTFMMLPQERSTGVIVEVDFDYISGIEVSPLTAEIKDLKWEMGKTVTYKLSITPEYDLEFITTTVPQEVDAHYDIIPIKIKADDMVGDWTIESDQDWLTFKSALTAYEKDGWWLNNTDEYKNYCSSQNVAVDRGQTLTKSGSGEFEIYLYISENITETDRTVNLTLKKNGKEAASIPLVQKCPIWESGIGWEVIEEEITLPYGFKWNRIVTLQKESPGVLEEWILKQTFKDQSKRPTSGWDIGGWIKYIFDPDPLTYVEIGTNTNNALQVTIDYTKITNISSSMSITEGQANTLALYNNVGGTAFDGEQNLISDGYEIVSESGSLEDIKNFAALYAVKLNAFNIIEDSSNGQTAYSIPVDVTPYWYLPASGQFSENVGLSGQYWSSTAAEGSEFAHSWNNGTIKTNTDRMEKWKVRAVRQK